MPDKSTAPVAVAYYTPIRDARRYLRAIRDAAHTRDDLGLAINAFAKVHKACGG